MKGIELGPSNLTLSSNPIQAKQQLQKLLELGGNCVFTSGRPISPDVLQLTDEAGILVVAEMPAAGLVAKDWRPGEANFNKTDIKSRLLDTHKDTIDSLITRDKNHPSVISWSLLYNPVTMMKEDEMYYSDIAEAARQSDWEKRPLALTMIQSLSDIWAGTLKAYSLLILKNWTKQWHADVELLQSAMYKELVDWEAKQPDKALAVVMGCDSATEQSGIGQMIISYAVYREASEKVQELLTMLSSMPNVQGHFLQGEAAELVETLKKNWK